MFRSLCKFSLLLRSPPSSGVLPATHLLFLHLSYPKPFSEPFSTTAATFRDSTRRYLVNKLALSPEAANAFVASKKVHITGVPTRKFTAVVAIFREYGFSTRNISKIVIKYPPILLAKPETNIRPKLDFFIQNGISGQDLVRILSKDPKIFERSLRNLIIPCITFLRDFLGSTRDIVDLFMVKRGTWVLHKFTESMAVNAESLRKYKVPESNIFKMLILRPAVISRKCDEFNEILEKIHELGFNPERLMFIYGLSALAAMKEEKWNSKLQIFKSFGWTDDQLKVMFVKQPQYMNSSEEHLRKALELFSNELEWRIEDIIKYPKVLFLSLGNRILPRAEVVKVLASKGLVNKRVGWPYMVPNDEFLKKYVMPYLEQVPQLLEIYHKRMNSATAK